MSYIHIYPDGPAAGIEFPIQGIQVFDEEEESILMGYDFEGASHELMRGSPEACRNHVALVVEWTDAEGTEVDCRVTNAANKAEAIERAGRAHATHQGDAFTMFMRENGVLSEALKAATVTVVLAP